MKVNIKQISGNWHSGYALDKHLVSSTFTGHNEYGHPTFDNVRTEVGEALYQLKYKSDQAQAKLLAQTVISTVIPLIKQPVHLVVPVPASTQRRIQPVYEVAKELAALLKVESFENIIQKAPAPTGTPKMKDIHDKDEKRQILANQLSLYDGIQGDGKWNALLIDDLYDSGASMETACAILNSYAKIGTVFTVAITWK